ncbi:MULTISPECIES: hypothetical protein [Stenotrophomonas]|jgi:hypothetical protein|uniref:Uncharacterized protein n=1 Tax=Stenotrophomonas maltophilia TaxID=40324 RepID=A0AA40Y536_STEMA|nr:MULTISPECIES: hypothetical protein [Stenotrophomonas]TGR41876.1 hypothetical protein EN842_33985 [bacterium M00.F.Ca.ET.199.01.1.1]TGT03020.1 hypothetical protein EN820_22395 [bacterium M00.F.Ca.ET.177.01.1.1]TGT57956.1 hypothetical protein EN813_035465 [Mesorhizobium sp. M00.F.Ca.ET.170.01.1.1]TGU06869.1 hypothetical protein EN806_33255 [bacterium M00.F.Ca.ET.163.01.1.1]TGU91571.1 hypothetical protein EN794_039580 [Mesorhizobium sp. M00.F.Ca.ET.151.01.1.1]TGV53258.1 hypothetical protein E
MPVGIQVFNADGSLGYDPQGRLFRVLASIQYSTVDGSAAFSRQPEDTDLTAVARGRYAPDFSIDVASGIVSWRHVNVPAKDRYPGIVEIWAR